MYSFNRSCKAELSATWITYRDNVKVIDKRGQAVETGKATSCLNTDQICLLMIFRRPRCLICSKLVSRRRRLALPPWTLHHPANANTIPSIRWSLPPLSRSEVWRHCCNLLFFYTNVPSSTDLTSHCLPSFNKLKSIQTQSTGPCVYYTFIGISLFSTEVWNSKFHAPARL